LTAMGYGEVSLCVAVCRSKSIWAVGLASNQKKRVQAARLSLCIALAANADSLHEVRQRNPDFLEFCSNAGVSIEDSGEPPVEIDWSRSQKKKNKPKPKKPSQYEEDGDGNGADEWAALGEDDADAAVAQAEAEAAALEAEAAALEAEAEAGLFAEEGNEHAESNLWPPSKKAKKIKPVAAAAPEPEGPEIQRDTPLWISPLEDIPAQLQALNPEGLVLANDGTGRKALYSGSDAALSAVLGDAVTEVEIEDDPNWDKFPGVGAALKQLSEKEECFTVAFNQTRSLWVVGVGMKGKNRHAAAKVGLAALIAVQQSEIGEDVQDLSELPALAEFVEEVRSSRDAFLTGM